MSTAGRAERRQSTKRSETEREVVCPSDWARARSHAVLEPVVRLLHRLGLHPNTLTLIGFVLQVAIGVVYGLGHFRLGGALLLILAPTDAVDGALARASGQQSRFGAFLDSSVDRLSDAALILGIAAYYLQQGAMLEVILLSVALVAAMMVSYTRARAEALGLSCKVGLLTRMERIILIGALTLIGLPVVLAWALAILSVLTVIQRVLYVYALSRRLDSTRQ